MNSVSSFAQNKMVHKWYTPPIFLEKASFMYNMSCGLKTQEIQGFDMISANNVTLRIGKKALFEDVNKVLTSGTNLHEDTGLGTDRSIMDIPNVNK